MQNLDIKDIMQACRKNDANAQRCLYEYAYPYGITVALYYSNQRSEAEEVLQDSFLKVFRALKQKGLPREFQPWFRRIIINTAIDFYRKRHNNWTVFELPAQLATDVVNGAEDKLNQEDLYRLLQLLPPAYRLVFNLHVLEGYRHPEIARELGISVGTSKSNLAKARRKLQKLASPFFSIDKRVSNA